MKNSRKTACCLLLAFITSLSQARASYTLRTVRKGNNMKSSVDDSVTVATGATKVTPVRMATVNKRDPIYVWSSLVAGVGSGVLASFICAPLDLIRTRMQVWGEVTGKRASAIPQMLGDIIARDGWQGCFRGLGATLLTVPAFWGVYFPLYDVFKRHWLNQWTQTSPALIHMSAAVSAGAISDVICNPMFVVRTRLQTEALHAMASQAGSVRRMTLRETAKSLYAEGGPLIFWRGMSANLLGLSHVAVQFPVYEHLKSMLRKHKKHESALDLLVASGLSKMTASLLTYPHEVIRSRMMDARHGVRFVDTCQRVYATEGILGFYAGLPVSLIRVIPNTCITFITYELFLRWAKGRLLEHQRSQT